MKLHQTVGLAILRKRFSHEHLHPTGFASKFRMMRKQFRRGILGVILLSLSGLCASVNLTAQTTNTLPVIRVSTDTGARLHVTFSGTLTNIAMFQTVTLSGVADPLTCANGTWTVNGRTYFHDKTELNLIPQSGCAALLNSDSGTLTYTNAGGANTTAIKARAKAVVINTNVVAADTNAVVAKTK